MIGLFENTQHYNHAKTPNVRFDLKTILYY